MSDEAADISDSDIVFECPHCGNTIAIEQDAAGMEVKCPDCQASIRVPGEYTGSKAPARAAEPNAVELARKLDLVKKEMALIQSAIDRVMSGLQD